PSPAAMLNHIQTDLRIPDSAKSQHALESDAKKRHALSDDVVLYAFDLDRNSDFRPILQKLPASGTPFGCRD
ncbi:hypothetical protein GFL78_12690, partial [Rhizobium leguminosarum bv. viciae]